jgi:hypothetical protein
MNSIFLFPKIESATSNRESGVVKNDFTLLSEKFQEVSRSLSLLYLFFALVNASKTEAL